MIAETKSIKLLVVDDDPQVRAVLARTLQSFARARGMDLVLKATADGAAALELMPTFRPDVVLLDQPCKVEALLEVIVRGAMAHRLATR